MASGHRSYADMEQALRAGISLVKDPGASGTITWDNKQEAICELVSAGGYETRALPAASGYPLGQRLILIAKTVIGNIGITGAESTCYLANAGEVLEFIVSETSSTVKVWRTISSSRQVGGYVKTVDLPIGTNWRAPTALLTSLATTSSGTGATGILGMVTGTLGTSGNTLLASATTPSNITFSARDNTSFQMPLDMVAGQVPSIRVTVTETTPATTAFVDIVAVNTDTPGTDICTTSQVSCLGGATATFELGSAAVAGDILDVAVRLIVDGATCSYSITKVQLIYLAA